MADTVLKLGQKLQVCQTRRSKQARYWIDEQAVAAVIERMGLTERVRIRRTARTPYGIARTLGTYRHGWWVTPSGGLTFRAPEEGSTVVSAHDITVSAACCAENASRTIYHELRHAWQSEQARKADKANDKETSRRMRFDKEWYEHDAEQFEAKHDEWGPLATRLASDQKETN